MRKGGLSRESERGPHLTAPQGTNVLRCVPSTGGTPLWLQRANRYVLIYSKCNGQ